MLNMLDIALRNSNSQRIPKETTKIEPKQKNKEMKAREKKKTFSYHWHKKRERNSHRLNLNTNNGVVRKADTLMHTQTGKSQVER